MSADRRKEQEFTGETPPGAPGEGTAEAAPAPAEGTVPAQRGRHRRTDEGETPAAAAGAAAGAAASGTAAGSGAAAKAGATAEASSDAGPAGGSGSGAEAAGTLTEAPSDTDLVARMREGDSSAYDELYRRHAEAVRRYARTCCRDADTADDLTNEVFARTLQAVRGGKGPETSVRAYLLTSVRHVGAAWTKTRKREQLVEDFAVFVETEAGTSSASDEDTLDLGADVKAMRAAEQTLVVKAFRSLSEKDQMVLWHTTVEESKPQEVAPLLGMTDNATAVAAHRARENLKKAYLQAHVSRSLTEGGEGDCARYADRLGAYARGSLRARAELGLRRHLKECERCREAAAEVMNLNEHIRLLVPVAFIGWFATAGGAKAFGLLVGGSGAAAAAGAGGAAAAATGSAGGSGTAGGAGAASEGLGTPAKIGIAAGATVAAGAVLAYALSGGEAPKKPEAKPKPPPVVPTKHSEKPKPEPKPEPPPPPKPKPKPKPEPEPKKPAPKPKPKPPPEKPEPKPKPPPKPEPTPTPTPTPTPKPPPPPKAYPVNELPYEVPALPGKPKPKGKPTVRLSESTWLWQRYGMHIGGEQYGHGVSVHVPSSVTVDLNGECTAYDALAGIDDMTLGLGRARFSVYGDGARLWRSPLVRGGQDPVPVHVPLSGVKTLRLVTEPDAPADSVAVADWAQSRITCR